MPLLTGKVRSSYGRQKRVRRKENFQLASTAKEKIEKILVVTLINHPYIIGKVMEDFMKLEFGNAEMRVLKERILRTYMDFSEEAPSKFLNSMLKLRDIVGQRFGDIEAHADFVDRSVSDDVAIKGWSVLLRRYLSDPLLDEDLQRVSTNFVFSEDDWQRLRTLKNEVLSRGRR